jgi:multiphosphoryl transfer protein
MALPLIPGMKAAIGRLASDACRRTLEKALTKTDGAEVRACARDTVTAARPGGVLHPDLVITASAATSKGEAIKELTDCLSLAGRVGDADAVEEAIWRREDVYSTGMGFGFSVPHCKSAEVTVDSIAVLRLKEPVEWASSDKALVSTVILLAVRDVNGAQTHMNLFAKLARKLMHEDFRKRLSAETDAEALTAFIGESLGLQEPGR